MAESEQTSRDSSLSTTPSPNTPINHQIPQTTLETNTAPIINHKLNGHNYLQWSQSIMMFISGRSRDDYLTGTAVQPTSSDPRFKVWRAENNLVSWLISSMTAEIGENVLLYTTAKEIWDAARDTFSSSENTAELFHVESILHDLRQGEKTVTTYFSTLTRYWQQLDLFESYEWKCPDDSTYFKKIVETKRTFKFLMGLDKSLDEVRGRILGAKPLPSLREAFFEVRREESRKRVMMGHSTSPASADGSALAVAKDHVSMVELATCAARGMYHTPGENRPRRGRPWCDHCKKPGHLKETCWKLHGKPPDWKPNRGAGDRESRVNAVSTEAPKSQNQIPFTKDQ